MVWKAPAKGLAAFLRNLFPGMLTPDFRGSLEDRMTALSTILADQLDWTIIGSSLGGLMAALFTCSHPSQVNKLILLAPALILPDFAENPPTPVSVPTVIYHGKRDELIPLEAVQRLALQVFLNLDFRPVDDDHGLYRTVHEIDWQGLLQSETGGA